jgi:hypothetical protein
MVMNAHRRCSISFYFGGSWCQVTDRYLEIGFIGQLLPLHLPEPRAMTVQSAAVGGELKPVVCG